MTKFTTLNLVSDEHRWNSEELLPLVYEELRKLAAAKMARENKDGLQPTALVHEAYLRLVGDNNQVGWDGKAHFFAAASEAMRRILVDRARKRRTQKRGGDHRIQNLPDDVAMKQTSELLEVHEALDALAATDSSAAELVKLRYFGGLSMAEASQLLGISIRTAHRDWEFARAWLAREIRSGKS